MGCLDPTKVGTYAKVQLGFAVAATLISIVAFIELIASTGAFDGTWIAMIIVVLAPSGFLFYLSKDVLKNKDKFFFCGFTVHIVIFIFGWVKFGQLLALAALQGLATQSTSFAVQLAMYSLLVVSMLLHFTFLTLLLMVAQTHISRTERAIKNGTYPDKMNMQNQQGAMAQQPNQQGATAQQPNQQGAAAQQLNQEGEAAQQPNQQGAVTQQPNQQAGWGQQPQNQQAGWGQQQVGWGQQQAGWGQQQPNQQAGWGQQQQNQQAGWGQQQQNQQAGWGQQPQNQQAGWGQQQVGWGQQQAGWGQQQQAWNPQFQGAQQPTAMLVAEEAQTPAKDGYSPSL